MANKLRVIFNYLKYRHVHRFKSRAAIEAYQEKGIKRLMKHLDKHSLYYHGLISQSTTQAKMSYRDRLRLLPIMDKVTMMANFDRLVCVPLTKEEGFQLAIDSEKTRDFKGKMNGLTVGLSSGTSAHRGLFIASQKEADIWTGSILARMLPKMSRHHEIAFFLRANSNLYENVKTKRIGFTYYDIYEAMDKHIEGLNHAQADILIAPPSVLMVLGEAIAEGRLKLRPDKVISVAEVLEDRDRDYFCQQFNVAQIHQVYQCTEGFLAYTCDYGTLHINEDIVLIEEEAIDEERFIPIITDFTRRSQPIVRYRLNDVLVHKKEACPCGCSFTALEKIEGREDDVFIFSRNKGSDLKIFPDIIRRCILYVPGIKNYEVIQINPNKIQINLDYSEGDKSLIQEKLRDEFAIVVQTFDLEGIEIEFGDYKHTTERKMKRVRRI